MKKFISFLVRTAFTLALCAVILAVGFSAFRSSDYYKWYQTDAVETADFGSPHKFYFKKLNNLEKHVYNEILTQIYGMPESIEIPAIDAKQLDRVFSALLYDNPDLFFVGRKCTLSSYMMKTFCSVEYIVEKEEYESLRSELMSSAERVIASLTKPDDEWQTELEIHDYIIENCRYELDEPKLVRSSAYGALVDTGGQWVSHPGGDGIDYMVNICHGSSPITEGLEDFPVCSEHYYLHIDPAIEVLATTRFPVVNYYHISNKPVDMPVAWTKFWGNGRVFYTSLGHHDDVFDKSPNAQIIMERGMLWAGEGKQYAIDHNLTTERFENQAKMY